MLKSMTGFGAFRSENKRFIISVEVKSLNSKYMDLNLRVPRVFSDKDIEFRNIINEILVRGKVNLEIEMIPKKESLSKIRFNKNLFDLYYAELKGMADKVVASYDDLFKLAIQSPDVMIPEEAQEEVSEVLADVIKGVRQACKACDNFRIKEGENLSKHLTRSIQVIDSLLGKIEKNDKARVSKIKKRIKNNFTEIFGAEDIDKSRFEQELLYYLEKLDLSEEKVRLQTHLNYFLDTLKSKVSQGKKLGFITQELGREINTIGSKANDVSIQKLVVSMKDELEKIKEQLANIL